jgi:PAS domain S-box-containing protein
MVYVQSNGQNSTYGMSVAFRMEALQEENVILRHRLAEAEQLLQQHRQAEEQLRAELRKCSELLELSTHWVWEVDTNATYTYVSPQVQHFLGYATEEILGKTPFDFMPPEEAQRVAALFGPIVQDQEPFFALENANVHKDGHRVVLETSGVPVFDSRGTFCGYRGLDRDITEKKQSQEEYARLQQQVIEAQRTALQELTAPLLPLADGVVALPLVGALDSARAQQVMETLLEGIAAYRADIAIVDITGIQVVDTQVAQAIISTAQAVQLLGAQVVLTGIQPQIAQTLVHLGADMRGIVTRNTLQRGIAYAMSRSNGG